MCCSLRSRRKFPLLGPKLDGDRFVIAVTINEQEYTAENEVGGDKVEGRFKGPVRRRSLVSR